MTGRRAAGMVFALLFAMTRAAMAAPYYVEGHEHQQEEEAKAQLMKLLASHAGLTEARVLRRYAPGAGWRYLVHVDAIADQVALKNVIDRFPGGVAVAIDLETGAEVKLGARSAPTTVESKPEPTKTRWWHFSSRSPKPTPATKPTPPARQRDAEALLMAAIEAHGGADGGRATVAKAQQVRFRYQRTLTRDGVTISAEHLWVRSGTDRRLDVRILEGAGSGSTTVVRGAAEAWVQTANQLTDRPPEKAKEVVERFGPLEMMAYPLGFAADIETAGAWRGLQLAESSPNGVVVLRPAVPGKGLTEVGLHAPGNQVAYVEMTQPDGVYRFEYDDYRAIAPGVVLPFTTRMLHDGRATEELKVLDCDLGAVTPSTTFERPQ